MHEKRGRRVWVKKAFRLGLEKGVKGQYQVGTHSGQEHKNIKTASRNQTRHKKNRQYKITNARMLWPPESRRWMEWREPALLGIPVYLMTSELERNQSMFLKGDVQVSNSVIMKPREGRCPVCYCSVAVSLSWVQVW